MRATQTGWMLLLALATSLTLGCGGEAGRSESVKLQGAGASFPAPLYSRWFKEHSAAHKNVQIDYQSIGSGGGVKGVIDKTVDFGASDAAISAEEQAKVEVGVQMLPMTAGSIVLAYNLEGVSELKLSRDAYTGIFLGKIKKWNDPAIAQTNPGVNLPEAPINVVTRSDSSGTSYVFSQHLSAVSPEFASTVGTHKQPNWPVGSRSKGNEGVTGSIRTTPGSIGYVEYGYAANLKLPMAVLENKSGKYIVATIESAQASLAAVELPEDLIAWLPDPEGDESYPIVTYTWVMCYKKYDSEAKAKALKDVLRYCLTEGQKIAPKMGYVPLPESVVAKTMAALENIKP